MPEVRGETRHQEKGENFKRIIAIAVGTLVFLTLIAVGVKFVIGYDPKRYARTENVSDPNLPETEVMKRFPQPALQFSPTLDMETYQAQQHAILNDYAWIDKDTGLVRIPVDIAMKLYAKKSNRQSVPSTPEDGRIEGNENERR